MMIKQIRMRQIGEFSERIRLLTDEFYCARDYLNTLVFSVKALRPEDRLIKNLDFEIWH